MHRGDRITELEPSIGLKRRGRGQGTRRRARTEEAELAGVDLDEHVLAAHRRLPGRAG
jgi:hypothetical protein